MSIIKVDGEGVPCLVQSFDWIDDIQVGSIMYFDGTVGTIVASYFPPQFQDIPAENLRVAMLNRLEQDVELWRVFKNRRQHERRYG